MKLRSPLPWFYLLVASLPFDRIPSTNVLGINLRASLLLGAVFIGLVMLEQPRFALPSRRPVQLLYLFVGACVLSALLSTAPIHALVVTCYLIYVILLALAVSYIVPQINFKYLLISFCSTAVVACMFGFYQFIGDLIGLPLSATGLKAAYSGQVFGFPRIQAMSLEPLYFANYLLLPISLLVVLGTLLRRSWLVGILLTTTLLLTLSRGGVGGLVVVGMLWSLLLLYYHSYRQAMTMVGVGALAIVITMATLTFVVPGIKQKPSAKPAVATYTTQITSYEVGDSKVDRAYTRRMALQAFREYPVLGVGPGGYGSYLHKHNAAYPVDQIVNNEPAELLAETGILGAGAFLAFILLTVRISYKTLLARRLSDSYSTVGWAALFCLAGTVVQYYSFSTLYIVHVWVAVGLLLGAVFHLQTSKQEKL
jgi:O-antigen ligase